MGFFEKLFGISDPWKSVGDVFTKKVTDCLSEEDFRTLTSLLRKYNGFEQSFFQNSVPSDPDISFTIFSYFLGSLANQLSADRKFEDAEKVMRLSLQIQSDENPIAGSLAMLLKSYKMYGEAGERARKGLKALNSIQTRKGELPKELRSLVGQSTSVEKDLQMIINGENTLRIFKPNLLEDGYKALLTIAKKHFHERARQTGIRFVK